RETWGGEASGSAPPCRDRSAPRARRRSRAGSAIPRAESSSYEGRFYSLSPARVALPWRPHDSLHLTTMAPPDRRAGAGAARVDAPRRADERADPVAVRTVPGEVRDPRAAVSAGRTTDRAR